MRAGRRRDGGRRGFYVVVAVGSASLHDFFPVGGGGAAERRAEDLLRALGITHTSPAPDDFVMRRIVVRLWAAGDALPRIIGYAPAGATDDAPPAWTSALDALTGDRRRRRPEAVARARVAGAEVHHRIPRRAGGGDEAANLEALAPAAHDAEERRRREFERSVPEGLAVGEVVSFRAVVGGWALGLRLDSTPTYRDGGIVYARSPNRIGIADVGRRLAVILERDPLARSGFRFVVAGAADADDEEAVDDLRWRIFSPEDAR